MKKKIVWACLAGLLSGSVFGLGSLNIDFANHVNSCNISYYGSGSYLWALTNYTESGTVSGSVSFENSITLSNITVDRGYLPVVSVIDEYLYDNVVTNRLSESSGNYSYKPRYDTGWVTFDLQTILITNTIAYVTNGGILPGGNPTTYTIESAAVTLPEPSYAYHVFGGWYDNSDLTGVRITTIPTGSVGNKTFYAKWLPATYAVTLDFGDGLGGWISFDGGITTITNFPFVTNRTYGVDFSMPSFGRTGYLSSGWHVTQDGSDTQSPITYIEGNVARDTVYYAILTKQGYVVTLDPQGGTGGSAEVMVSYNEDMGPITPPSRMGYDFAGYYDEQGQNEYYNAEGKAKGAWPLTSGGTLYAHWVPHSYTVSFVGGEGTTGEMAQQALTYDVETNLTANAFSKTGYQFAGWKTNGTDSVTFADGQTVSNLTAEANGVVTMTATWLAGHYFIAFDANATDAEGEMALQDIEYDKETALSANAFTRVGYSLAGWAWNKDATTNEIDFADCQIVTNLTDEIGSTNTLYAVWSAEVYEVSLDANAAKGGYFREVTNVVVTVTTNIEGTVTNVVQEVATNVVKLVADQFKVTYDAPYDLPVPINEGLWMTFVEWKYVDPATGDLKPIPATVPLHAEGVTNLVAQWTDGLAPALNAAGTDLEYKSWGNVGSQRTAEHSWSAKEQADGEKVGQSGDLPVDGSAVSYLQTVLPGAGVLTYRWRIFASVGLAFSSTFYGNRLRFVDSENPSGNLVSYLATGNDYDSTEWRDSGWQEVAFTNNSVNPLTVEWRFESQSGLGRELGGTGWVDNVTWTPAGGSRPVATVTPYDGTYDGAGHGIAVNVTTPASGATVEYALAQEGPYSIEPILFTNVTETTVWYTIEAENYATITNSGTVKISPKALTEAMVSLAETSYTYDGSAKEPAVTVTDGESSILTMADYEVSYSNNVAVGEATVIVTGKGNYAGEVLKHFTISSADEPPPVPAEIAHEVSSYEGVYDGEGHGITVSVTTPESGWSVTYALDEAGPYAEGEILFTNVTETAVTVWYTVEAASYATVTNSGTVKISPKALTDAMVSLAETSYTYDGNAKEPTVTVADGSSILTAADYDVAYSNNVAVGEATVVVTGKGNYAGEVQKHFTIASAEPPSPAEIAHEVSSYEGVYDGEGHGITVSVTTPESGWTVKYALDEAGPYVEGEILFTNVTETAVTVWYTVEAANYATVTNSGTVKILPDDLAGKIPWPAERDGTYNPLVANVYDGWIVAADGRLAGTVQVKAAKQAVKTVTDKVTKIKTSVTNVAVTATVKDVAGKSWSYKNGIGTIEGVVTGLVCTTKGVAVASFGVELGANGLSGNWSSLAVVGARNGMGTKGDAMMAALEAYKGSWSVAFTNEMGVTRLQLVVGAKGSTKITGTTADGFKVSATVQGVMGEDAFFVPYLATLKNGKLTTEANLLLCLGMDGAVTALASNLGGLVAGGHTTDAIAFLPYVESVSSKGGEAYAGAVVLNDLAYPAKFAAKGLPAGLKIDAATGVITGTPTKPGHYVATVTVTSGINNKAKVETTVAFDIANYTDDRISVEDDYGPYCVGVKVYEPIAAALGCTVSGLPAGLKYAAKNTTDATFGAVPAGTVYGVPTKAGESTVYFKKSTKETNDVGKVATVNRQASATFRVAALPAWAQGSFDGAADDGATVSLTVAANGKISGKLLEGGKTWTLAAAAYDEVESRKVNGESLDGADEELVFIATVVGKSGKEVLTNAVAVTAGTVLDSVRGVATSDSWTAWQNLWKTEPWKAYAKPFANKTLVLSGDADGLPSAGDTLTLKFAATGAVTASGKFVTGQDARGDVVYSASCSSVLIPESEVHYTVYLYFPPKAGKFDSYAMKVPLEWNGSGFILSAE